MFGESPEIFLLESSHHALDFNNLNPNASPLWLCVVAGAGVMAGVVARAGVVVSVVVCSGVVGVVAGNAGAVVVSTGELLYS